LKGNNFRARATYCNLSRNLEVEEGDIEAGAKRDVDGVHGGGFDGGEHGSDW